MHARNAFHQGYRKALERDQKNAHSMNNISIEDQDNDKESIVQQHQHEKFLPENTEKLEENIEPQYSNNNLLVQSQTQEYLWYKGRLMNKQEAQYKQQEDNKQVCKNLQSILIKGQANGIIKKMSLKKYDEYLIEVWKSQNGKIEQIKRLDSIGQPIKDYPVWWNQYKMPYYQLKIIFQHENQIEKLDKYLNNLWTYEDELFQSCTQLYNEICKQKKLQQKHNNNIAQNGQQQMLGNLQKIFESIDKSQNSQKELEKIQSHLSHSNLIDSESLPITSTLKNSNKNPTILQQIQKYKQQNDDNKAILEDSCETYIQTEQLQEKDINRQVQKPKVETYMLMNNTIQNQQQQSNNYQQNQKNICNIF